MRDGTQATGWPSTRFLVEFGSSVETGRHGAVHAALAGSIDLFARTEFRFLDVPAQLRYPAAIVRRFR
jgi:hypothetical protein